ncbi:stage II sporulation protein R [Clostridium saccharobutylicum]|uniref:Stage II sporulation protein SpoIIR n=1 Tax=Clostridium saccharobutylicum TaxID=169679 RepID=A0A1S8N6K5_CLOSA|nr:stage II sporulation protein R [Clostridium saccharobutylicum]OOM12023.1 stage II sporulation protein SpoIIR [Clostridium saccharobutylicum]
MKKSIKLKSLVYIGLVIISTTVLTGCFDGSQDVDKGYSINQLVNTTKSENKTRVLNYDEVKDSLIRFHVIANSDSEEDQNLKIEIKNRVIDYLYPYLNESKSIEQSRQIIKDNMNEVKKIAEDVIKRNNYNYDVKLELSRENFPDKSYGNITLPQGNYEAFRIIIGSGEGKNWWCVMFPPLCFVDESKAEVEYDKVENRIKSNDDDSNNKKDNASVAKSQEVANDGEESNKQNNKNNIQIKFKIVETIKNLFN